MCMKRCELYSVDIYALAPCSQSISAALVPDVCMCGCTLKRAQLKEKRVAREERAAARANPDEE